ncbi:MAG: hypothetical protein WC441_03415 [Patescibacteria group bacterium]
MKTKNQRRPEKPALIFSLESLLNNLGRQIRTKREIKPEQWPLILKVLTDNEVSPGGPYYNINKEIDPVLNLRIFNFLKSQGIILPKLEKFLNQDPRKKNSKKIIPAEKLSPDESKIYRTIHRQISRDLKIWPQIIKARGRQEWLELGRSNQAREIILLPLWFIKSLGIDLNQRCCDLAENLGRANFYLWLAYNIYDDILDEGIDASLLPIANLAFRNFVAILQGQKLSPAWDNFFHKLINELEAQNYQEYHFSKQYFKQPITLQKKLNFEKLSSGLYKKSIAHAAGPLAILSFLKVSPGTKEFRIIFSFFKNYLNARQLDDDVHDWESDLKRKKATPTLIFLTQKAANQAKNDLDHKHLRKIMFEIALPTINIQLAKFIKVADQNLKNSTLIKQRAYLKRLIEPLSENMARTESLRSDLLKFKNAYQGF